MIKNGFFQRIKRTQEKEEKRVLEIEKIRPNPYQPRKNLNLTALEDLCRSIKQYGVLQPICVRKINEDVFELISGQRRLKASEMAGLKEIPAKVINVGEDDSAVMALIENLQREELNYLEEAEGYFNLLNEHGITQEQLARKMGKSQSTIANKIRLLKLPNEVKKFLCDNNLTERHARALLKLHDEKVQLKVLRFVTEKNLNVKKTEYLIEKIIDKYVKNVEPSGAQKKLTKAIKDVRIFVNTVKEAIELMKKSGVDARAAQIDKGDFFEFVVRIPKEAN